MPASATVCDLVGSLSFTVRAPARFPAADGRKTTEMEQVPPGATVAQLLVCEKSPPVVMPETVIGAVPMFERVTPCDDEEEPTICAAKVNTFAGRPTLPRSRATTPASSAP